MKIAIHNSNWGFTKDWIEYCRRMQVDYKTVDCYSSDIIEQISDCDALMWHHHHTLVKDALFAGQLLSAVQHSGRKVFPDFNTAWHFDDKVGQKYLLESINAPVADTFLFYSESEAMKWLKHTQFPKVFKLRGGAGSRNVRLVSSAREGGRLVKKAFRKGFATYNKISDLREHLRRFEFKKKNIVSVAKSIYRLFFSTPFSKTVGPQKGYILFQEYIPGNLFDIRIVVIGARAFGIKRMVRENDFRASGSGEIKYGKEEIDIRCVSIAFETTEKLWAQCVAFDFVFDPSNNPLIVEINYGYAHESYFPCPGYWDQQLDWHAGSFNSAEWMVEDLIQESK
jgi:glutathione synthase/RimK-type ligase-like ATP-grasp enzyme